MVRDLPDSDDAVAYMRRQLFSASGGRDVVGPDLLFRDGDAIIGIDVKTFDCSSNKKYFAINDHKHAQLAGQCAGYMGLVCPCWARSVCVLRPIPYDDVSAWVCEALRAGGSESRNLPIKTAMAQYDATGYSIEDRRAEVYLETEIRDLARKKGKGTPISGLSRILPAAVTALTQAQASL